MKEPAIQLEFPRHRLPSSYLGGVVGPRAELELTQLGVVWKIGDVDFAGTLQPSGWAPADHAIAVDHEVDVHVTGRVIVSAAGGERCVRVSLTSGVQHSLVVEDDVGHPEVGSGQTDLLQAVVIRTVPLQPAVRPFLKAEEKFLKMFAERCGQDVVYTGIWPGCLEQALKSKDLRLPILL